MESIDGANGDPSRTLTFLGCGTLGTAILQGLLASFAEDEQNKALNGSVQHREETGLILNGETHAALEDDQHLPKPSQLIACVRTADSAKRLRKELAGTGSPASVVIVHGENARAVQAADTVLLGCQPQDLTSCLGDPDVRKALRGKLLISILAGVTIPQIEAVLDQPTPTKADAIGHGAAVSNGCISPVSIVRAMPNTAAFVRASMTVISPSSNCTPAAIRLVEWLFTSIGTVTQITHAQFDVCTALCGSTPAFFALFIDSLLDGAVALGLKRSDAQTMAAATMKGAAMLLLNGEQPDSIKEKVATPGGSSIQGLMELERKALRATVADALIKCTASASVLGSKQA
ncbi:MAG: hypothetical protein Q9183_002052 [Haloplaca sp. 2 TL-2023]